MESAARDAREVERSGGCGGSLGSGGGEYAGEGVEQGWGTAGEVIGKDLDGEGKGRRLNCFSVCI